MSGEWPIVAGAVALPPMDGALDAIWNTLLDLAERLGDTRWTLVGGQMVFLHASEHNLDPPRVSTDIETAVDVRADPKAIRKLFAVLADLGFTDVGVSPEGYEHRFEKVTNRVVAVVDVGGSASETAVVDILSPEGLSHRTDTRTSQGRAFPSPGASQALHRSELVGVSYGRRTGWIPRPGLLGAIVGKATAATVDGVGAERHLTDLAFLLSLVDDPFALQPEVTSKDRARLQAAAELLPDESPTWNIAPSPNNDARAALHILMSVPGSGR